MMKEKVFKIVHDIDNYQTIVPVNDAVWENEELLGFDCKPVKENWKSPEFVVFNPKKKKGDFFYLSSNVLVFNKKAKEAFLTEFEIAGEILELNIKNDETLFVLNVLDCTNALNKSETTWRRGKASGLITGIDKHSFNSSMFTESGIFKLPETSKTEVYAYANIKDQEDEFYYLYQEHKMTGLLFQEIWSG